MCKLLSKKHKIRNLYNLTSKNYSSRYQKIQFQKYKVFESEFLSLGSQVVFDIGGGTGLLSKYFHVCTVLIDISFQMLQEVKDSFTNLVVGDAECLPIRHRSLAILTSVTMIQNLTNPILALSEFARVLTMNGTAVITTLKKKTHRSEVEFFFRKGEFEYKFLLNSTEDYIVVARLKN